MKSIILIIGGMGPQASLLLHRLVIDEAAKRGAKNNNDYPSIIHLSIPVPDFINNEINKNDARDMLLKHLKYIQSRDITNVVIACNTAHLLMRDIEKAIKIKPLSLITATIDSIERSGAKKVGLVTTPTTESSGIYKKELCEKGIGIVKLDRSSQYQVEQIIREVIANNSNKETYNSLLMVIEELEMKGAELILLGCTELSVITNPFDVRIVDPLRLVAKKLLET